MKTYKFKTNIQSRCVDRVASYLDNTKEIITWYIDTNNEDKVLTIQGEERLARRDVIDIVNLAGFSACPLKNGLLTRIFGT